MGNEFEFDPYLRVVSMDAESAMEFAGLTQRPVDLGPPTNPDKYKPGARVWGFPSRKEPAKEVDDQKLK